MITGPTRLRIDSGGDEFPVTGSAAPRLSWRLPDGAHQTGCTLQAKLDGTPLRPVTLETSEHDLLPWPWPVLRSRQRAAWRVRIQDGDTASAWSDWSRFEAGLFDADWTARWISPAEPADPGPGRRPAYSLAAEFELAELPESARLYATALGVYEAYVNGERAGTAELTPGSTSYDRTLYAQAYDVTDSLRAGGNRLELLLSDGWYRGQVGAFRQPAGWGDVLAARAELHLGFADGETLIIRTDESWTSTRSAIVRADLMDGQTTDLLAAPEQATPVLIDRVAPPPIDWSPAPPARRVESLPVQGFEQVRDGLWLADFGQNASGWISLSDLGPAGTRTMIDYGEHRGPDGDLQTSHLDAVYPGAPPSPFVQRDEVVSDGADGTFEPRHTVHGFRYARLTRDAPVDPASLTMHVVHSALEPTGTFVCSDADLVRLWDAARWSFRGNAVDVPTDCPTRERLGWTGDYQVFISTATRLYDVLGFSRKWLRSVRDDQLDDGRIANFSPDGRRIKLNPDDQLAMMTGSAGWGDAIVHVPWQLYLAYRDREVLAENWPAMVRWTEWALATARTARHPSRVQRSAEPQPHEQFLWDGSFHWGEWCEPRERAADGTPIDPLKADPKGWFLADKGEVGTAYLHRTISTMARIAELLGRAGEAERYRGLAGQVLEAWRTEFLAASTGRTATDSQAAYVRALAFDLIPDDLRPAAASRLVELIRGADDHLATGFLSTADLLPVLADTGHAGTAYALLFQRTSPSWLGMIDQGATTIWEDWDGIDAGGDAHDSLNHYSKGAVVRFLHSHTLGLRQADDSAGWESFRVAPVPHPKIGWAQGTLDTPRGRIDVAWRTEAGRLHLDVEVPSGAGAVLELPGAQPVRVGPGRHACSAPA
ncbi:family 78 glycoside hydrolase catalytic domain [Microlunatus sp. GCM10028923]|uniref:family 78 glycoside hydrolase catalytic domain n=1 Tax=Microlunatus sp. GCM10028923 TaxID=3273400 RepID=UPI0036217056